MKVQYKIYERVDQTLIDYGFKTTVVLIETDTHPFDTPFDAEVWLNKQTGVQGVFVIDKEYVL